MWYWGSRRALYPEGEGVDLIIIAHLRKNPSGAENLFSGKINHFSQATNLARMHDWLPVNNNKTLRDMKRYGRIFNKNFKKVFTSENQRRTKMHEGIVKC